MKINLKDIPKNPGVYIMKNIKDKIIYIGKAKNLRNRVSSYFNNPNSSIKTFELVKHIENIDFFVCNNELEALILENNLIKKHKPKYNILLKDNKTYPYLKITNEKFPKITIVRSRNHLENNEKAYFFGPFPFNIKGILKTLLSAFEIKNFNIDMYNKKIVGVNLRHDNFSRDFKFENKEDEIKYINNINNINESAKAESNIELSTNQYFKKSKLLTDFRIMGIPESVTNELYRAIGDTEKISYICGVIFQAKRYVSNQTNHEIYLEELSEDNFKELTKCILRALKKDLTENTVEKFDRYLFVTIQKFFENYVLEKKAQVPLVDWNL